ncbi:MAG: N-acetylmuramoyl-L-alanine amidase [Clostridia bacterium]|nr:N-acetylmuramoyl-L-alanine amidase [Clostridia bacterium]
MKEHIVSYAVKNDCYKAAQRLVPVGIVVHSTGANNPYLRRYVDSPAELGENIYNNHWNNPSPGGRKVCVHAFIGYDAGQNIRVAQILPYNMACWGCGQGGKGSYNSSHIQFEICEDNLNNRSYFEKVFSEAIEYCAYLCYIFRIDISDIVSHAEAYKKGYASNHGDCDHWLKRYGWTMDTFRKKVSEVYRKNYEEKTDYASLVCEKCGFTSQTREYLDRYTYSEDLWRKLWLAMG